MEEQPSIRRTAANILRKHHGEPAWDVPPAWELGKVLTTPHRKKWPCYDKDTCASGLG